MVCCCHVYFFSRVCRCTHTWYLVPPPRRPFSVKQDFLCWETPKLKDGYELLLWVNTPNDVPLVEEPFWSRLKKEPAWCQVTFTTLIFSLVGLCQLTPCFFGGKAWNCQAVRSLERWCHQPTAFCFGQEAPRRRQVVPCADQRCHGRGWRRMGCKGKSLW